MLSIYKLLPIIYNLRNSHGFYSFHLRYALFQQLLHPGFEGDLGKRAVRACAEHFYVYRTPIKLYKFNIAQMSGNVGTYFRKRFFNFLLHDDILFYP